MPFFGFDTDRISLWKWCRLRGADQAGDCDDVADKAAGDVDGAEVHLHRGDSHRLDQWRVGRHIVGSQREGDVRDRIARFDCFDPECPR